MIVLKDVKDMKNLFLSANRERILKSYNKEQLRAINTELEAFVELVKLNNLYLIRVEIQPNDEEEKPVEDKTTKSNVRKNPIKEVVQEEETEEEVDEDFDIDEEEPEETEESGSEDVDSMFDIEEK